MTLQALSIFPGVRDAVFARVDLATDAAPFLQDGGDSPFLDPEALHALLGGIHQRLGASYSFGGYLEDRGALWRGSYLSHDGDGTHHLGIDVNVPAGMAVTVKYPCTVAAAIADDEQDGGWGGTLIFELDEPVDGITHVLYAHLSPLFAVSVGDAVEPGDIVGLIALPQENGGWFEHLHIQALTREAWDMSFGDLAAFDGYGACPAQGDHPLFPNPERFL